MATIVFKAGEHHSKSGFGGGFAHILGKGEGFSREYMFGRGDDDMAPRDVTYRHEAEGADLDLFRAMLDDKRLAKSDFAIEDGKPVAPPKPG